jgi:hypothetical protein
MPRPAAGVGLQSLPVNLGPAPPPFQGMDYQRSYKFIFEHTNWLVNVALVFVCQFIIPIVGPIVCLGYFGEMIEHLHQRNPRGPYPNFDFGRFGDYLKRGIWPFLAAVVGSMILVPVIFAVIFVMGAIPALVGENGRESGLIVGAIFMVMMVLYFAIIILLNVFLVPILLAAELTQEFAAAFNFNWILDFLRRVWKELLLSAMFLTVTALGLTFVGALLCCVGIYPLTTLIFFAQTHLYYQLYELYLARGGQPLAIKTQLPPVL